MSGSSSFRARQRQGMERDDNGQSMLMERDEREELKRQMSLRDVQIFELKRTFPSAGSLKKKIRALVYDTHVARHELQSSMVEVSNLTTELQELKTRAPMSAQAVETQQSELAKLNALRDEKKQQVVEKKREIQIAKMAATPDRSLHNSSSLTDTAPPFDVTSAAASHVASAQVAANGSATNTSSSTGAVPPMNGSSFAVTEFGHGKVTNGSSLTKYGKKNEDIRAFSVQKSASAGSSTSVPDVSPTLVASTPSSGAKNSVTPSSKSSVGAQDFHHTHRETKSHDADSAFVVPDGEAMSSTTGGPDSSPQVQGQAPIQRVWTSLKDTQVDVEVICPKTRTKYSSIDECAHALISRIENKLHAHYQEVVIQTEQQSQTVHTSFNAMHGPQLNPQINFSFFPNPSPFPMFQQ